MLLIPSNNRWGEKQWDSDTCSFCRAQPLLPSTFLYILLGLSEAGPMILGPQPPNQRKVTRRQRFRCCWFHCTTCLLHPARTGLTVLSKKGDGHPRDSQGGAQLTGRPVSVPIIWLLGLQFYNQLAQNSSGRSSGDSTPSRKPPYLLLIQVQCRKIKRIIKLHTAEDDKWGSLTLTHSRDIHWSLTIYHTI